MASARLLILTALLALSACVASASMSLDVDVIMGRKLLEEGNTLLEALALSSETSTLLKALEAAGVEGSELSTYNATVFAPTNEEFREALARSNLTPDQLLADAAALTRVLAYHVVPGVALAADNLQDGMVLQTLLDGPEGQLTVDMTTDPAVPALRTSTGQVVPILSFNQPAGAALVHSLGGVLSTMEASAAGGEGAAVSVLVTP